MAIWSVLLDDILAERLSILGNTCKTQLLLLTSDIVPWPLFTMASLVWLINLDFRISQILWYNFWISLITRRYYLRQCCILILLLVPKIVFIIINIQITNGFAHILNFSVWIILIWLKVSTWWTQWKAIDIIILPIP